MNPNHSHRVTQFYHQGEALVDGQLWNVLNVQLRFSSWTLVREGDPYAEKKYIYIFKLMEKMFRHWR